MSNFLRGMNFAAGGSYDAESLHQLIENAELLPQFYTSRTPLSTTAADDLVLVSDASDSDTLKQVQLSNLLPSSLEPTFGGVVVSNATYADLRLNKQLDTYGWVFTNNGSTLRIVEAKQADSTLPKVAISAATRCLDNAIVIGTGSVCIGKTSPVSTAVLDVAGGVRASGGYGFKSNGGGTLSARYVADASNAYIQSLVDADDTSTKEPVVVSLTAPTATLMLGSDGNVGIGEASTGNKLHVAGVIDSTSHLSAMNCVYAGGDNLTTSFFACNGLPGLHGVLKVEGNVNWKPSGGAYGSDATRWLKFTGGILTQVSTTAL